MAELFDDLARILQDRRPDSVLLIRKSPGLDAEFKRLAAGPDPSPLLETAAADEWLRRRRPQRRHRLGVVWDAPARLPDAGYDHLLAALRDLDCEAVYVRWDAGPGGVEYLRSLGFLPLKRYSDGVSLHYFDVYDYKLLPDWLNSRFWANPEMWDKARW